MHVGFAQAGSTCSGYDEQCREAELTHRGIERVVVPASLQA